MREIESPPPEFHWTLRYPPTSHVFVVHFRKASKASTCDGGVVLKINIFFRTVQCFDVMCVVIPFASQKLASRAKD